MSSDASGYLAEPKSKIILCLLAVSLSPCAYSDSIFTCHSPFMSPSDQVTTAEDSGNCSRIDSSAFASASVSATFSFVSPSTPSYLTSVVASSSVQISATTPITGGESVFAKTDLSLSESFHISGYSGDGTLEIPFFTVVSNSALYDPSPTCGLTLENITKSCSGTLDSVTAPFSAGETLTLTVFGSVQATGLFPSDNFFQTDIFAIYPPTILDSNGVVQTNAGLQLGSVSSIPEPNSLLMMLSTIAIMFLGRVAFKAG
jgi:hypothetical protein